jgi:hypothetical protein
MHHGRRRPARALSGATAALDGRGRPGDARPVGPLPAVAGRETRRSKEDVTMRNQDTTLVLTRPEGALYRADTAVLYGRTIA